MDTNPLAADPTVIIEQNEQAFNDGLIVLSKLTENRYMFVMVKKHRQSSMMDKLAITNLLALSFLRD